MIDGNGPASGINLGIQLDTILDPQFEASPVCFGLPREYAAIDVPWTFDFSQQVSHPQNLDLTYSMAPAFPSSGWNYNDNTFLNSGLNNPLMGSYTDSNPVNLTDFENNGIITWTPSQAGFYAMQVWVTDSNGIFSPIDFIVQVITVCT